jgi:hypothetical protein
MPETIKVSIRQRLWALSLVALGVWPMVSTPSLANGLAMGAFLLFAWREAYYPSPSLRTPLRDVARGYRDGTYISDRTSRTVGMAAVACLVASFVARVASFMSS